MGRLNQIQMQVWLKKAIFIIIWALLSFYLLIFEKKQKNKFQLPFVAEELMPVDQQKKYDDNYDWTYCGPGPEASAEAPSPSDDSYSDLDQEDDNNVFASRKKPVSRLNNYLTIFSTQESDTEDIDDLNSDDESPPFEEEATFEGKNASYIVY